MDLQRLDRFGQRHHGLVSRSKAASLGISSSSWYRALDRRLLEPLYPNVARLWGSPSTRQQKALAAVWAAGDGAMASHRTSVALWGVERPEDDPIDVLLPARSRGTRPDGVIVHRPRDLLDLRPIVRDGIPVTNPMRTLLDLGAVDPESVPGALITVLSARLASPAAVRSALARHAKKGRHGVVALRAALEQWLSEDLPPDSQLEAVMASFLVEFGLPPVTFHAAVAGFEVDFLVENAPIVLECDGWGIHGLDRNQFEFDRMRDSVLVAAGYVIVHFTWRQLTSEPAAVAARLTSVIRRWAPWLVGGATG